jgi:hypothetical protein
MPVADLDTLEYKLGKRGFRREDGYLHQCTDCGEQAVLKYVVAGKTGGRDISLCQACGSSRSWRSGAGLEAREEDTGFDLRAFLA